jgi:nucleoid-associated protein YgaU
MGLRNGSKVKRAAMPVKLQPAVQVKVNQVAAQQAAKPPANVAAQAQGPAPKMQVAPQVQKAQANAAQQGAPDAQKKRLDATQHAADAKARDEKNQAEQKVQEKRQQAANQAAQQNQAPQQAAAQAQQNAGVKANDAKPAQNAGQNAGQQAGQNAGQNAGQAGGGAPGQPAVKGEIDKAAAKGQEVAGKAIDQAAAKLADKLPEPLKGLAGDLAKQAKAGLGDLAKGGVSDAKNLAKEGAAKLQDAAGKAIDQAVAKLADQAGKLPGPLGDLAKKALGPAAEQLKKEVAKQIAAGLEKLVGKDGLPGGGGLPGAPGQGPGQAGPLPGVGVQPPGAPAGPAPAGGGKSGELIKLKIKPEKGAELTAQFNPAEYTVAKATPWKHHTITGLDAPQLEFTSGEPVRLSFELIFDTYDAGKNVRETTDKLEKLGAVHQELHRPPVLLLTWGTGLTFKCVLERFNLRYTLFLEDGTPVRAVANCTFVEFTHPDEQLRMTPRHSPDRTKRRILREGETLSGIAGREYEDPTQWRLIADANGIIDPLSVKPGTELRIPPLIRHR